MILFEIVSCRCNKPTPNSIIHIRRIPLPLSNTMISQLLFQFEGSMLIILLTCSSYFSLIHKHKWQTYFNLLSHEFIFTLFIYQVKGHKSTKTWHTHHHIIICIITFKQYIGTTKSTKSHPILFYRNINIVHHRLI